MTDPTEQVAEVIRELIKDWPGVTHPRATAHVLARAAVDALELTGETAFRFTHLASGRSTILETGSSDVAVARKIAGETHELSEVSRLVGPWVEGNEQ
jgi:hypothetical protein